MASVEQGQDDDHGNVQLENVTSADGEEENAIVSSSPPAQQLDPSPSPSASYSTMAAKTVANIRRLQENVSSSSSSSSTGVSSVWLGNLQLPCSSSALSISPETNCAVQQLPEAKLVQQISVTSPVTRSAPSPPTATFRVKSPTESLTSAFNALITIDPQWQSTKRSVRERNAIMYNNSLMADVYFRVGGGDLGPQVRIPAHKYVLATGSSVFCAMFFGGLAVSMDHADVEVPDVEPVAFHTMLRYLYCDEISLDNDNVLATLYCCKKYIVPHLAEACIAFLEKSLSARNACVLLSQARLFEEPELTERSWEVMDAQAELALMSECFAEIDFDTLNAILARETLNCKETVVFRAAVNWARAECRRREMDDSVENRRLVLRDAIDLVRFPAMTHEDFADEVATSGMLSLKETTDIFLHFFAKHKPALSYSSRPRIGLAMQSCHRFGSSAYRSNQWRYRGRCDAIQFCVDRRVFVVGFGLYGSSNGASDYAAKIELKICTGTGGTSIRMLAESKCKFVSDGSSNTFKVFFEQPVQVEPDQYYTASVVLDGPELSYFGQEGLTEVTAGAVTFQFQCSAESTNGTGVQGGQIPDILFYGPNPGQRGSSSSLITLSST